MATLLASAQRGNLFYIIIAVHIKYNNILIFRYFYRLLIQCLCKYFVLLIDLLHLFLCLLLGSDTFGKLRTMASEKMEGGGIKEEQNLKKTVVLMRPYLKYLIPRAKLQTLNTKQFQVRKS